MKKIINYISIEKSVKQIDDNNDSSVIIYYCNTSENPHYGK